MFCTVYYSTKYTSFVEQSVLALLVLENVEWTIYCIISNINLYLHVFLNVVLARSCQGPRIIQMFIDV